MDKQELRTERIWCYLTKEEKFTLRRILQHIGVTDSTWLRQQVLKQINESVGGGENKQ